MMRHRQTETRHLFEPETPKNATNVTDNEGLGALFVYWLEVDAQEDRIKSAMVNALPDWTKSFVHVFTGKRQDTQARYVAVSWQETPDREAIHWGEVRPDHIEKYTVQGSVSYMLNDETIAQILTMLPPERK